MKQRPPQPSAERGARDGAAATGAHAAARQPTTEQALRARVAALEEENARLAQARDALRNDGLSYRAIVESVRDHAIVTLGRDGRITSWNQGARNILGYAESEVLGQPGAIFFTPEDQESRAPERELEEARAEGRAEDERWYLRKDGSRFWGSGLVMPLEDGQPPHGFVKVFRDLPAAREAKEALRASEERFRALASASSDVVYRMSPDWGEMRHLQGREFIADTRDPSRTWLEKYIHPDDQPLVTTTIREAVRTKSVFELEHRVRRVDGSLGWTFSRAVPLLDARGEIVEWFGAASDTTERKRAETALRESEAKFRTLAESIPQLAWMAEPDGHIFWYNRRWYDYTGTTLEEMQGWGWRTVHHPDHVERVTREVQGKWAAGLAWEGTYLLRSAAGEWRWFLTRAEPIRDEKGELVCWFGTNTDVTEQRETEAQLERLVEARTAELVQAAEERRRAEEALRQGEKLRALGQLTGGIAHDFNNMLQVVAAGARLLKRPGFPEGRRDQVLDSMVQTADNAKRLVDGMLAFARRKALRPAAFDLNARLLGTVELLRRTLDSKVRVETDLAPDLWPAMADPAQLETAVLNLAVNARQAMPEGGALTLQTRNAVLEEPTPERPAGEFVRLAVKDTGRGMAPGVLARACEPFFTTKPPGEGTGLGLPQVHGFAKQSGGDIHIESEPGEGTTVTILLPRASGAAEREAEDRAGAEAAGRLSPEAGAGRVVLVVEDNAQVAAATAAMLEELGYATRRADGAAAALALLAAGERVDAVLSDIVMPGEMDGLGLADALRRRFPRLPVVLATGYSDALARRGGDGTAIEVLGKPYGPEELTAALARAFAVAAPGPGGAARAG